MLRNDSFPGNIRKNGKNDAVPSAEIRWYCVFLKENKELTIKRQIFYQRIISSVMEARSDAPHIAMVSASSAPIFSIRVLTPS